MHPRGSNARIFVDRRTCFRVGAGKWARGGWAADDAAETRVKEETQATLRCFPFKQPAGPHVCLMTGLPAKEVALFAKSY